MITRRGFLAATPLLAISPAAGCASAQSSGYTFDRSRFEAILAKRVRHKQCFGATAAAGGEVLFAMNNSIKAYDDFLHEGPQAMQAVAVLYHGSSILMGMNDAFWNTVLVPYVEAGGARTRRLYPEVQRGKGNPYLHSTKNANDVSVESLAAKGSSFFVCHNAVLELASEVSTALKQPMNRVHAQALAAIVPAALVVPAGVMAINAAQEARFTYIQVTL